MGLSYEKAKKVFLKTILILGAITIFEVAFALLGKGYIIEGFELPEFVVGGVMIILSLYKAFLIVFEFMHMKYEAPTLMRSVLLPLALLIWGVIAFLRDGNWWETQREVARAQVEFVMPEADDTDTHHGMHGDDHGHGHEADHDDRHDHGHDGDDKGHNHEHEHDGDEHEHHHHRDGDGH